MIRIGIDAQIADVSKAGIGQVTASVCSWLPRVDRDATYVELRPVGRTRDFSMPERLWWDQVALPRLAVREKIDVLFKPAFSCPVHAPMPTVILLHDLVARLFPEQLNRPSAWYFGRWCPWSLRFAARVIADSEHTAADAQRLLGLPAGRMRVVLQGIDIPPLSETGIAALAPFTLSDRFILHVGTIEPRKNLAFLVRAFSMFHAQHPSYSLVLAGADGWHSRDVHEAVSRCGLQESVRFLGPVTQEQLIALYHTARVLAFPTLYEGFGRPPLEAMAAGTPVVAAATSSVPEVVGDAGILVSGYDESAWAEALEQAAEDPVVRGRLGKAGPARSAQFNWDRAARQIAGILHEAADGN